MLDQQRPGCTGFKFGKQFVVIAQLNASTSTGDASLRLTPWEIAAD
ncbi:hypothetical protein [Methylobacter svalbardensis]